MESAAAPRSGGKRYWAQLRLVEPEDRHRLCWYSRRTRQIPPDLGVQTIIDGELLYCAHPMLFPIVGFEFDVRNCLGCDYFKGRRPGSPATSSVY